MIAHKLKERKENSFFNNKKKSTICLNPNTTILKCKKHCASLRETTTC